MISCIPTNDLAASANDGSPTEFLVTATAETGSLIRVLGLFAVRDVIPRKISCACESGMLSIRIEVDEVDETACQILLAKLREIVAVTRAALKWGDRR